MHDGARSEPSIANAEELTRPCITRAEMWDTCHVNTCAAAGESFSAGLETFGAETDEAPCVVPRRCAPYEERRDDGSDVEATRRARNAETTEATLMRRTVRGTPRRRKRR